MQYISSLYSSESSFQKIITASSLIATLSLITCVALTLLKVTYNPAALTSLSFYTLGGGIALSTAVCLFGLYACYRFKGPPVSSEQPTSIPLIEIPSQHQDPAPPLRTVETPNTQPLVIPFAPPRASLPTPTTLADKWEKIKHTHSSWSIYLLSQALQKEEQEIQELFHTFHAKSSPLYETSFINIIMEAIKQSAGASTVPSLPNVSVIWNGNNLSAVTYISGVGKDRQVWELEELAHFLAVEKEFLKDRLQEQGFNEPIESDKTYHYKTEDLTGFFNKQGLIKLFSHHRTQKDSKRWFLLKVNINL